MEKGVGCTTTAFPLILYLYLQYLLKHKADSILKVATGLVFGFPKFKNFRRGWFICKKCSRGWGEVIL